MKTLLIAAAGLLAMAGLIALAVKSTRALPVEEIERTLVDKYFALIKDGRYGDAYEQCLTGNYRKYTTLDEFCAAHENLRMEIGVPKNRELREMHSSYNLFTRTRDFQFLYRIEYPTKESHRSMIIDDSDGEYRIDGTYTGGLDNMRFMVW